MTIEEMQIELERIQAESLAKEELIKAERLEKDTFKQLAEEIEKTNLILKQSVEDKNTEILNRNKELEDVKAIANTNSETAIKLKLQQDENASLELANLRESLKQAKEEAIKEKEEASKVKIKADKELQLGLEKIRLESEFKDKKAELIASKITNTILIKALKDAKTQEDIDRELGRWDNIETMDMVKMTKEAGTNAFANLGNQTTGNNSSIRDSLRNGLKDKNAK